MKRWQTWLVLLSACWLLGNQAVAVAEEFEPTWGSLSQQPIPQWLKDAKFGVYTHRGVFDGAYHMGAWTGGVCTPSRHMVMSGRTVWHIPNMPQQEDNSNPPWRSTLV